MYKSSNPSEMTKIVEVDQILVYNTNGQLYKTVPLLNSELMIGRESNGEVPNIDYSEIDQTRFVSRRHAIIYRQQDKIFIRNLSKNTLHVNKKLLLEQEEAQLVDNSMIILSGKYGLIFKKGLENNSSLIEKEEKAILAEHEDLVEEVLQFPIRDEMEKVILKDAPFPVEKEDEFLHVDEQEGGQDEILGVIEPAFQKDRIGQLLFEVAQNDSFTIHSSKWKKPSNLGSYQIVIEKTGSSYIAVLNDVMARPMYLVINGEFIHEWSKSNESYFLWLKEQVVKMLNIPLTEFDQWKKLLIIESKELEDILLENVTIISRKRAMSMISDVYPVLVDFVGHQIQAQLTIKEEEKQMFIHVIEEQTAILPSYSSINQEQEELLVMRINQCMEKWFSAFGKIPILVTGYGAISSVRAQFTDQFVYASSYPNTNLAWEVAHFVRK